MPLLLRKSTGVVIVGAGPAGLAPLFAAACAGKLRDLLARGVTILERSDRLGCGVLPRYAIRSDSTAESFLDILLRSNEPSLRALRWHPLAQSLAKLGKSAAPLPLVAEFLELAGGVLCDLVAASEHGQVLRRAEVLCLTQAASERWTTRFRCRGSGEQVEIESAAVVLAVGAAQPRERLTSEMVAGVPLLPCYEDRLLQSGDVLVHNGLQRVRRRLGGNLRPRVVIVGGSTSAGATAARLLQSPDPIVIGDGDLTLMHRRPLRIFYESVSDALADNYDEFRAEDVCSRTGRVFRFSGFRLDSRELIMAARGIGNRPPERRLRLFHLTPEREEEARQQLGRADLIIAALGYRPGSVPLFSAEGERFRLTPFGAPSASIVDESCKLRLADGRTLANVYAIGLAVGPAPTPDLGGERDFHGQVNSLWMWQHMLGLRIAEELIRAVPCAEALHEKAALLERQSAKAKLPHMSAQVFAGPPGDAAAGGMR